MSGLDVSPAASVEAGRPVLRRGDVDPAVPALRALLANRGFEPAATDSDRFDRDLEDAVEVYQSQAIDADGRPLAVDGIVGPMTWWALTTPYQFGAHAKSPGLTTAELPDGGSPLGRMALRVAIAEALQGAKEIGRNNSGPWVERYLNGITPAPANWCAGFVSYCVSAAADILRVPSPIRHSLGARDILRQLREQGLGYTLTERLPQPGDVVVWWRGRRLGWMGHIGIVHHVADDGVLWTIEGNRGAYPAPVRTYTYALAGMERLLGFGRLGE
ncbi:MAG: CHAP domain-containing protein [Acidobacteriota bacterium]